MEIAADLIKEAMAKLIAMGINGKVPVISVSLQGMGWLAPTSVPYSENIDRFNRPIYHNDNIL